MEIQLTVEKSAFCELSGTSQTRAACNHRAQELPCHERRSVHVQLERILSRVTVRREGEQRKAAIDQLAAFVDDFTVGCNMRRGRTLPAKMPACELR